MGRVLILWPRSRSCLPGSRPRWGHRPIWYTFIAESDFFAAPLRTFCCTLPYFWIEFYWAIFHSSSSTLAWHMKWWTQTSCRMLSFLRGLLILKALICFTAERWQRRLVPSYEFLTTCACHGRVENPLNLQDLRRSLRVSWGLNLAHPNVPRIHTFGPTWVELLDRSAEGSSKLTGAAQRPSPLSNISGMLSWWHYWWNCFLMQEILWLHSPF